MKRRAGKKPTEERITCSLCSPSSGTGVTAIWVRVHPKEVQYEDVRQFLQTALVLQSQHDMGGTRARSGARMLEREIVMDMDMDMDHGMPSRGVSWEVADRSWAETWPRI